MALLHLAGDEAQEFAFVLGAEVREVLLDLTVLEVLAGVPVFDEDVDGVLVHRAPVAREFTAAPDDRQDGEDQRVAREFPHGGGRVDGGRDAFDQFPGLLGLLGVREREPLAGERADLLPVEVLEHEVGETGAVEDGPLVAVAA